MDPVTHVTTGLLLSQLLSGPSRAWSAVAGLIFTLLPDIDYFLVYWDRLAFIRYHRGFTHSLWAVLLLALLGAGVGRALGGPRWFRPLFFLGLAVLSAHVLLDLATSYGTQIFNPLSRRRFSLDWLFIIDPYFTALLVAGAAAALLSPAWGRKLGACCLAAAGGYLLLCGLYHHRALNLARQAFPPAQGERVVAALPQPFSPRRWQLIAAGPGEVRQAFVELPVRPWPAAGTHAWPVKIAEVSPDQDCEAPPLPYQAPGRLVVCTWKAVPPPAGDYSPEAREILTRYLEFARFPLLCRTQSLGSGQVLEWLDLRFSVPGRAMPFGLRLQLDGQGRLKQWLIGRGRSRKPYPSGGDVRSRGPRPSSGKAGFGSTSRADKT
jgi:inner membrane protein